MRTLFDQLFEKYKSSGSYVSERARQKNTDQFISKFHDWVFSDEFAELTKENFIAYVSANKINISQQAINELFDKRYLMHNAMANGFLSCLSGLSSELAADITTRTTLSFDLRSQMFKSIAAAIVEDSANVVSIKLLSEASKHHYANELLTDHGYLHLANMSLTAQNVQADTQLAFDKLFAFYDGADEVTLLKTGVINRVSQPFIAYMRDPGNDFNGQLFDTGLNGKDLTNSLIYQSALNSEHTGTWLRFMQSVDLASYTVNSDEKTNALVHFLRTTMDRVDFAQEQIIINNLDSSVYRKIADPEFLKTLPIKDGKFLFDIFLKKYATEERPLNDLASYLTPAVVEKVPFVMQALLDNYKTRKVVIDYCLSKQLSPVTYASKFDSDINELVNNIYAYNSANETPHVLERLNEMISSKGEGTIDRVKAIYQAIEFKMYLYNGGSQDQVTQQLLVEDIESLSRQFRVALEQALSNSPDAELDLSQITQGSRWTGSIEIERVHNLAMRVLNQHNLERAANFADQYNGLRP